MEPDVGRVVRSPLGTVLTSRYEIRAPLGRGGMGEVFEAVDRHLDRTVAVKILRPELAADRRLVARFRREARTTARLSHPGIVAVHDVGEHDGRVFIVMEFVAGTTLTEIARLAPLPPASVARIGAQVAAALAHAHDRGVVHRDVAPGNVMLTASSEAKLLDLGIAAAAQGSAGGTGSISVRGTLAYVAPEQARGGPTDQRVDLYALGAVLTELLTGDPPSPVAGGWAVQRPRVVVAAGQGFAALLDRCLAFDPTERYARADDLAWDLRALAGTLDVASLPIPRAARSTFVATSGGTAPLPVIRTERLPSPAERPVRRRSPRFLVAAALAAIVLGAAWIVIPAFSGLGVPVQPSIEGPDPIAAPTGLVAASHCDGWLSAAAEISWIAVEGADAYRIHRSESNGDWRLLDTVSAGEFGTVDGGQGTLTYVDRELGVSLTYRYRVQALDGPRVSRRSAPATTATPFLCFA